MANWEYKVAYVDFRGRISSEGAEYIRQGGEHRTGFVRGYLDKLGEDGWELTGMLPLLRPESSYFVLKRCARRGNARLAMSSALRYRRRPAAGPPSLTGDADTTIDGDALPGDHVGAFDEATARAATPSRACRRPSAALARLVGLGGLVDLITEPVLQPARLDEARARRRSRGSPGRAPSPARSSC